ncbi:ribonucleoside hydrolase [Planobispora takensis]|uniref:Ribonucleoside hydrolase n=1 Tax=Planobispora takensis TaxID=1367882 RepID=A0A8J3WWP3_9ACTN|nr:ribonucleoside hydrolase [Planobispora takensis]
MIIDCDPGIDDAMALALAAGSPELEILGITTVAGNVDLDRTTANALRLREFLGMDEVPVVTGSPGPLSGDRAPREDRPHGISGLGTVVLPEAARPPAAGHAAGFLVETVRSRPGEVTLVAVGPLTNIALALRAEPRLAEWARGLVLLGGSYTRRPAAPDFNMAADPEAAAVVFGAGWTVTAIGVDIAGRARAPGAVVEAMRATGRLGGELLVPCVEFPGRARGAGGPAVYDVCAVAHVIDPAVTVTVPAAVTVETAGDRSEPGARPDPDTGPAPGTTLADLRPRGPANALVATGLDVDRFWELTLAAYRGLGRRLG